MLQVAAARCPLSFFLSCTDLQFRAKYASILVSKVGTWSNLFGSRVEIVFTDETQRCAPHHLFAHFGPVTNARRTEVLGLCLAREVRAL